MRLFAQKSYLQRVRGERRPADRRLVVGMNNQGGRDIVKIAAVRHIYFAADRFFRRAAEDDRLSDFIRNLIEGNSGADTHHGNEIMPAAVPDFGQSVIFRHEADFFLPVSLRRFKSRSEFVLQNRRKIKIKLF